MFKTNVEFINCILNSFPVADNINVSCAKISAGEFIVDNGFAPDDCPEVWRIEYLINNISNILYYNNIFNYILVVTDSEAEGKETIDNALMPDTETFKDWRRADAYFRAELDAALNNPAHVIRRLHKHYLKMLNK